MIDPKDYPTIDEAIALTREALLAWAEALEAGEDTEAAERKFYANYQRLKVIRDPALKLLQSRPPPNT